MGDDRSNDRDVEGVREHSLNEIAESSSAEPAHGEPLTREALDARGARVRAMLKARVGEEKYNSWFKSLEFAAFDGHVLQVTVPVKFLKSWIQSHYSDTLLECSATQFQGVEQIEVALRQPTIARKAVRPADQRPSGDERGRPQVGNAGAGAFSPAQSVSSGAAPVGLGLPGPAGDGSPIDPRYTFESFVVGPANIMAHAGAVQAAETVLSSGRGFNPVVIHAGVGLGKTHLLQAIAWEVRRRAPQANVMYVTAERFRFKFIEAIQTKDAMAFKDRFRNVDMLLIDDFEFLQGERTELEFDHIINALLDGGRQLVVACARAPGHIERLNDRMRSRLQRGLVTGIEAPDYDLRLRILEKRLAEKRASEPSFDLPRSVLELVAGKLVENARELEGAVNRLHFHWRTTRGAVSPDATETIIRDLLQGVEPRRIRIEDILRVVIRNYGVSKQDLLSQRRHRSVVVPRQIAMYLAKQLTSRSLPEIGRRFGNRDHTTVLHAVRKIEADIAEDPRLRRIA